MQECIHRELTNYCSAYTHMCVTLKRGKKTILRKTLKFPDSENKSGSEIQYSKTVPMSRYANCMSKISLQISIDNTVRKTCSQLAHTLVLYSCPPCLIISWSALLYWIAMPSTTAGLGRSVNSNLII